MSQIGGRETAKAAHPFPVPHRLAPDLSRVEAYWRGLLRGGADMPFADDLNPNDLGNLEPRLFVIDVFDNPERFRFAIVGEALPGGLAGVFLDETALAGPFEFLRAQASATTEAAQPTYFRQEGGKGSYGRLLLPLWGEGRISVLLGAVAFD